MWLLLDDLSPGIYTTVSFYLSSVLFRTFLWTWGFPVWLFGIQDWIVNTDCIIYSKVKSNFPFMENFLTFDLSWPTLLFFFRHECKKKVLCLPRCSKTSTWIEHIKERAAEQFSESFLTHFLWRLREKNPFYFSELDSIWHSNVNVFHLFHYYFVICRICNSVWQQYIQKKLRYNSHKFTRFVSSKTFFHAFLSWFDETKMTIWFLPKTASLMLENCSAL